MSLTHWQHRYESWLQLNWLHDDKAHDIAHLRRVWMSAARIMQNTNADPLVVLTACYFHDVVNLPKTIRNAIWLRPTRRKRRAAFCNRIFRTSPQRCWTAWRMRCRPTVSAPALRRKR